MCVCALCVCLCVHFLSSCIRKETKTIRGMVYFHRGDSQQRLQSLCAGLVGASHLCVVEGDVTMVATSLTHRLQVLQEVLSKSVQDFPQEEVPALLVSLHQIQRDVKRCILCTQYI